MVFKKAIIIAIFFSFILPSQGNSEQALGKRINYAELPIADYMSSKESCILKGYWLSLEGEHSQSIKQIQSCSECKKTKLLNRYYCNLIQINNFFWLNNTIALSNSYYSMANDKLISTLPNETITNIINLAEILTVIEIDSDGNYDNLILNFSNGYPIFEHENQRYIVDTGALFGSLTRNHCHTQTSEKLQITSFSGKSTYEEICIMNLPNLGKFPAIVASQNILGQTFIKQFNQIVFSTSSSFSIKKLYKDNPLLFFTGDFESSGLIVNNIKYCLDSGSLTTTLMPSIYKKIRSSLRNRKIKEFTIDTPMGKTRTLGKLSDASTLILNKNLKIKMNKIPALFRNEAFNQCDIVLGTDIISKAILRIDLKNSDIYIRNNLQ